MLEFCIIYSFGKCLLNRLCFYLIFDFFDWFKNNNDENWYLIDIYKLEKIKEVGVKYVYWVWIWFYGNILFLVGFYSISYSGWCYSRFF